MGSRMGSFIVQLVVSDNVAWLSRNMPMLGEKLIDLDILGFKKKTQPTTVFRITRTVSF